MKEQTNTALNIAPTTGEVPNPDVVREVFQCILFLNSTTGCKLNIAVLQVDVQLCTKKHGRDLDENSSFLCQ